MSNQQNNNAQLDDENQGPRQQSYHARNFYRKRPGNGRQNQDLGEDENRAPKEDDTQRSNHSDENNDDTTRGRGGRGGFRRGRGRGRFSRGLPFFGGFPQSYSPYSNYVNGNGGFYGHQGGYYGQQYYGNDQSEQDAFYNYPQRGNRSSRGGRGRGRGAKNENTENNNDQPQSEENPRRNSNRRQRQRRGTNENASGAEQQTDGAVTDEQQHDENNKGPARQERKKSNQRRRRNTNASQSGAETEGRVQSGQPPKPKDDETIVKNILRNLVTKVARRLAPRNRRQSQTNPKEATDNNNTDVDQSQTRNVRRGGRGRRGGRPGNGYYMDQGYYDPYGMSPYYYGMYYGYGGGGGGGGGGRGGRGRGGRGRGRFRQRGGANKENQPQNNSEEGKTGESNSTGDNSQSKPLITEQVNQSSTNADSRQ